MNTYETEYFDIKTALDLDVVRKEWHRSAVRVKKKLNRWCSIRVFVLRYDDRVERYSRPKHVFLTISVNDNRVWMGDKHYDDKPEVIDLSEDVFKERVHVNSSATEFTIEEVIEREILPEFV